MGPYQGKQTSELALFRQISGQFQPGDIALADRFFCSYWVIADLQRRGVDVVFRLHQTRKADFRRGRRLGRGTTSSPGRSPRDPGWMSRAEYDAMPAELKSARSVSGSRTTKRVRHLVIVTTLVDAKEYPAQHYEICSARDGTRNWIYAR